MFVSYYMKAKHTFNSKNECARANLDKTKTTEWKKIGNAQQKAPSKTNAGVANLLHPNSKHPSTTNAGMANLLHPNPHMKYDTEKNEFRTNINKYNVIEIANCIKIHTYENNFIEVSEKKDIAKRTLEIKKQNK